MTQIDNPDLELDESLVCPQCRGEVRLNNGQISCLVCSLVFSIDKDIPIFLIEKASQSSDTNENI